MNQRLFFVEHTFELSETDEFVILGKSTIDIKVGNYIIQQEKEINATITAVEEANSSRDTYIALLIDSKNRTNCQHLSLLNNGDILEISQ